MEIVEIFEPCLYSVRYDSESVEYERLFNNWKDVDWLMSFFEEHSPEMDSAFWGNVKDPELASARTYQEAYDLEEKIHNLVTNTKEKKQPDLDTYFKPLGGEYAYVWEYTPMKAYGPESPSLIRLYAIKLQANCYIITGGGVKYCKEMKDSPELEVELSKIKQVREFLIKNAIIDNEDL